MTCRARRCVLPILLAAVSLLLTGAIAPLPAAENDLQSRFEDEVEISEVLLDVLVTDRQGNVILGLDENDFVVEEDGAGLEIEVVSFYSNRVREHAVASGPAGAPPPIPDDRHFVLLFYRPSLAVNRDVSLRARLPESGRQTANWIHQYLLPNDQVAVLSYDSRLRLAHDFTADHERLDYAISLATKGRLPKERWPSRTVDAPAEISLAELSESKAAEGDLFVALEGLATSLGRIEGRKILILFGPNFPSQDTHARQSAYRSMVEALNANNVAVYSIDVAGQGRYPTPGRLAEATGGNYLYDGQDFLTRLQRIQRENNGYYLLSYKSPHPAGTGGFQSVSVRTRNPDFLVRSRSGYNYGDSEGADESN